MINERDIADQLPPYRLIQKGVTVNIPVPDFEGLVTHHPGDNSAARVSNGVVVDGQVGRLHALVGGEIQEIGLVREQVLLKKDFILEDSRIAAGCAGFRDVDVPSPLAGYVGRRDDAQGLIDLLDRAGGEVIARVRHMDPIRVNVGDTVEYGQGLGMQNNQGTVPVHVHMEVDTRYYQHYENYMNDLVSGRLSIDPMRQTQGIEARPIVDDSVIRIGEYAGIVQHVQKRLNEEGFRGADNRPLQVDGVYRFSMQAAVVNYQRVHGLPQTGDIDPATLQAIAPRIFPPAVNDEHQHDGADHGLSSFMNLQGSRQNGAWRTHASDDPLLVQAERAVRQLEHELGRDYDQHSACMTASIACLAKVNGLSRIDNVVLSEAYGELKKGENLFVVQGGLADPAHLWGHMKTQDAVDTPVERSLAQLHVYSDLQQRQTPLAMDEPRREMGPQMRMG